MVTTPIVESAERRRRRLELQLAQPDLDDLDAGRLVDESMEAEKAERAEQDRKTKELTDSVFEMLTCPVPGCGHSKGGPTGLCARHGIVVALLEAEAIAAEVLPDGTTVRDWVGVLVEQRAAVQ
jgi:hypothetical protein